MSSVHDERVANQLSDSLGNYPMSVPRPSTFDFTTACRFVEVNDLTFSEKVGHDLVTLSRVGMRRILPRFLNDTPDVHALLSTS